MDDDLNGLILKELLENQRQLSTKLDNHYADLQARLSEYALRRELEAFREEVAGHFETVDADLEDYKRSRVPEFWKNAVVLVLCAVLSAVGTHWLDAGHAAPLSQPTSVVQTQR